MVGEIEYKGEKTYSIKPIERTFIVQHGLVEEDAFDPDKANVKILYNRDNPEEIFYLVERKDKKVDKKD